MPDSHANKATTRTAGGPLSEVEHFFVNQHPTMPLAELAQRLGRDEASLAGMVPERAPEFERLLQPIKREGKTVGTVWNPAASAAMDENRKHNPERPASAEEPADKDKCNHSPMGGRRKAPPLKMGRMISDNTSSAKAQEPPPQAAIDPQPQQTTSAAKTGAFSLGNGRPQAFNERQ
jgi:hypothetical protein